MGSKKTQDFDRLKDFKNKLSKKYRLKYLILFGSRAKNKYKKSSDYDLLVVSQDFKGIEWKKRQISLYPLWDFNVFDQGADFICYTPEEFERLRKKSFLCKKAVEEGIEI